MSLSFSSQVNSCRLLRENKILRSFRASTSRESRLVGTKAYVETSVVFAVTQQAVAYAVVLGAETAYTRSQLTEMNKGRPEILPAAAGAGSTIASSIMVATGAGPIITAGLITGLLSATAMMGYNIKRTIDTTDEDIAPDWPGPKAWPATMTLISFFAFNVFFQGLRAEL
ncbi:hypothetical protein CEUSTIGMA_g6008.t1 [Chlamydomonas eustigma]|uniref:Uncharacterized protein n=1 Tax=Chlamydomonas eustigma TaxID=1157962 RepID=A0A250X669_9CHLO|nr:hypothetical protein CEUSTIGMA_g6008.t1 [Chlamydomonas eustigma]|eukprot:GAX78568.1 hypothetical protein CEUSTIGMA_g6008.t1 [Chlamydomonas eustigma]